MSDTYEARVLDWMDFLQRRHAGKPSYPEPPHRRQTPCVPCEALRRLRAAGKPPPKGESGNAPTT